MIKSAGLLSQEEITVLRNQKSWVSVLTILSIWLQIALAFVLFILFPNFLAFIFAAAIIGAKQFQLSVLMHDGAHGLIFKNRKLNDFASQWFCAYPVMTDMIPYRKYHSLHHKYTETDRDPDIGLTRAFPTSRSSLIRKILRDLTGIAGIRRYSNAVVSSWGKNLSFIGHIKIFFLKLRGFLLTNLIIFGVLFISGNSLLYLALWWIPMLTFFSLFYRIRSITEHSGVLGGDDFANTRTTLVPWYLKYFLAPLNVNYHIEHHLFTFCPWYNLPKAHQMLKEKGFHPKMEIAFGYKKIFKQIILSPAQ
ncbi:fatty acid desaturase family protein [Gammaproteobacteria bacterium]|nr:fatty acid desaturase family protein [Gammaproteobacteria bacterium]